MTSPWLLGGVVLVFAGWALLLVMVVHAGRYRRFVRHWCTELARSSSAPRGAYVRMLICLLLWLMTFVAATALPLLGTGLAPMGVGVALLVALGVLLIVVRRTGRPLVLVPRPCRGMSLDEIEEWLSATDAVR